jgi:rhamnogalacturonyl hydrolase YesR
MVQAYDHYPLERDASEGGVSGTSLAKINGWKLSTDVGCAFMCVDGMAHYYAETGDERAKCFLDKAIALFDSIDLLKYKFQTHTTLTCLRGVLTLYRATGDQRYLCLVENKFAFYQEHGMTLTYENFNWFGREDTWTEPCAVVDSFILATELYKITKNESYKTLARRIWFNGLQFCQRHNGGAGPNTCVTEKQTVLKISMYEASFCCTMRYAEGLLEYKNNQELFDWNENAPVEKDELGRQFVDDKLLVEYRGDLVPIFSCNDHRKADANDIELNVLTRKPS